MSSVPWKVLIRILGLLAVLHGFAVGMVFAALFGCLWCAGGAVVAKGIAFFC